MWEFATAAFVLEAAAAWTGCIASWTRGDRFVWFAHVIGVWGGCFGGHMVRLRGWPGVSLVEFGMEVRKEVTFPVEAAFFVLLGESDDVDGGTVSDSGWRCSVVEDLPEGLERRIGEIVQVVGDAVGAEASMGIERAAEGGDGADPKMDRGPVNIRATGGGANGQASDEAAENILLVMAQSVQNGRIG